ncbi:MAG TPA: PorP/SprF family type IX secretion system membrane protein [Bacteroidales bacterium]|nr:PorP/SprF family type IX secretion system membrane protein [Bacteroidales bacterium]
MRKILIITWIIISLQVVDAVGQDLDLPDLTNYQHNWMVYNPAFTGSREVASTSVFYRQVDFTLPAPVYGQVSWHSPMKNNKVALGISYFNESNPGNLFNTISVSSRQVKDNLYLNYAFRIQAGGGRIAFGISAGATMYTSILNPNVLHQGDNYLLREGMEIIPNAGAGILYYNKDYFFGISVPKFLSRGEHLQEITHDFRSYTGVFTAGYEFNISENFTVSPTAMLLYKLNQPVNVQGGLNFGFFNEKVWFGGVYKRPDFVAALFNIELTPQIMLGYAFSYSLNPTVSYYTKTHEIVLRHELRKIVPSKIPFYY